jgi:WD40 repeat protein
VSQSSRLLYGNTKKEGENNWNSCNIVTLTRRQKFDNIEMEIRDTGCFYSVAWNHDSTKIASTVSNNNTVKIWDARNGELLNTLEGHSGEVFVVSWNHDGSKIVSGSGDSTIKIWDSPTGELLYTLEGHSKMVCSVSWNRDSSKIISGSFDKTIRLWDGKSGVLLQTLDIYPQSQAAIASWNHDDSKIASFGLCGNQNMGFVRCKFVEYAAMRLPHYIGIVES